MIDHTILCVIRNLFLLKVLPQLKVTLQLVDPVVSFQDLTLR